MDVKIYRDKPLAPDQLIGRIDERGKVFDLTGDEENYVGWIDYDEGDIYNANDERIGWAEDDGEILKFHEDQEEEIGFVTEEGELFEYYEDDEKSFGKLKGLQDFAEGAAALLFFHEEE